MRKFDAKSLMVDAVLVVVGAVVLGAVCCGLSGLMNWIGDMAAEATCAMLFGI